MTSAGKSKSPLSESEVLLIARIRRGEPEAWQELIDRFEGRLLAFVESRLRSRATSEDVVQETFIGFLTSLPNYDEGRPLESYLFSIAAHKLTDHLRREGRRPTLPLVQGKGSSENMDMPGSDRPASSILRSGERKALEEESLSAAIADQMARWRDRGDWQKIQVTELLFVRGWANKEVAMRLDLSEQTVANFKFDFLARLRTLVKKQGLSEDVFPELSESS
jgi:RNA polymerase sigma-70 factor (ECF subfamily)